MPIGSSVSFWNCTSRIRLMAFSMRSSSSLKIGPSMREGSADVPGRDSHPLGTVRVCSSVVCAAAWGSERIEPLAMGSDLVA